MFYSGVVLIGQILNVHERTNILKYAVPRFLPSPGRKVGKTLEIMILIALKQRAILRQF